MPEPEGELDLPIPVPRRRRRWAVPETPAPAQQTAGLPISAQYAAVLAMLAWVVAAVAGWVLAGALGGPPLAGAGLGAAVADVRTLGSRRGPVRSVAVVGTARRPRVILGE